MKTETKTPIFSREVLKFLVEIFVKKKIKIDPREFKSFLYILREEPLIVKKQIKREVKSLVEIASHHFSKCIYCSDPEEASEEILEAYKKYFLPKIIAPLSY
jgi:hypothetical protein